MRSCYAALVLCSSASFATGEASARAAPAVSAAATAAAATAAATATVPPGRTGGPWMGGGDSPARRSSSSSSAAAAAAAAAFAGSSSSSSGSSSTAGGGDGGACNEGDLKYTQDKYDSILTDMKIAVIGCALVPTTACFDYNLKKLGLGEFSAPCMGCWDDFGLCWQKSCVYSCLSEGVSDGCKRCLNGHCYSSLRSCTGIDCDHLPGCSDDRGSSAAAASPPPAAAGAQGALRGGPPLLVVARR